MKEPAQHPIAEVPRRQAKVEITIGIDLGDVWSHYCALNQDGLVVDRGRFCTTPKAIKKWFTDVPSVIGRAIRSMLRSWRVMRGLIRTSSGRSPIAPSGNSRL